MFLQTTYRGHVFRAVRTIRLIPGPGSHLIAVYSVTAVTILSCGGTFRFSDSVRWRHRKSGCPPSTWSLVSSDVTNRESFVLMNFIPYVFSHVHMLRIHRYHRLPSHWPQPPAPIIIPLVFYVRRSSALRTHVSGTAEVYSVLPATPAEEPCVGPKARSWWSDLAAALVRSDNGRAAPPIESLGKLAGG